jgi:3-mercaptopyruvate sulfurtransferase SseA
MKLVMRLAAAAAVLSWLVPAAAADPFQTASIEDVEKMLAAGDVVVYDVNPDEVYEKHHLPGARFLTGAWQKTLPSDRSARLLFYCSNPR